MEIKKIDDFIEEQDAMIGDHTDALFEMTNISTHKTGLRCVVWVQTHTPDGQRNGRHSQPRIKFQYDGKLIPVSIEDEPKILGNIHLDASGMQLLAEVSKWIVRHYTPLMRHWNGEITSDEFINFLTLP